MCVRGRVWGVCGVCEGGGGEAGSGGKWCLDVRDTPHTRRISRRAKGRTLVSHSSNAKSAAVDWMRQRGDWCAWK